MTIPMEKIKTIRDGMNDDWNNRINGLRRADTKTLRILALRNMFRNAKRSIHIYCERFIEHEYWIMPDREDYTNDAVKRGVRLKIYSKDSKEEWNNNSKFEGVSFKKLNDNLLVPVQFVVADCHAFLYTSPTQKPVANFYDVCNAARLILRGDTYYHYGKSLKN